MLPRWYTRWVEQLRTQPPAVKSHVALIGAVTLTTVIAVVWVTTLPARFSALGGAGSAVREGVSETLEEAPVQDALLNNAFTTEPEPTPQTEKELLRARVDALLGDSERPKTQPSSTSSAIGEPVLIEVR